jgi:hypothetical protein
MTKEEGDYVNGMYDDMSNLKDNVMNLLGAY